MDNNKQKQLMRLVNVSNLEEEMRIIIKSTNIITDMLVNLKNNGSVYFEDIDECIRRLSNIKDYCDGVIENDEFLKTTIAFE